MGTLWIDGHAVAANDHAKMAPKKRERCASRRAAAGAPGLINVEVDDSALIAGRLGPVSMPGATCATAGGRSGAVLSPHAHHRANNQL
jgi:hypothetical protein